MTKNTQQGITLLELLITLAVTAILVGIGVPSLVNFLKENRNVAAQANLVSFLSYARSEAIARGESVAICASEDDSSCSGGWDSGWIVFVDSNDDGARQNTEEIIRNQQDDANTGIAEASSLTSIRFSATGLPSSTASFAICDPDDEVSPNGVSISMVGRASEMESASVTCS